MSEIKTLKTEGNIKHKKTLEMHSQYSPLEMLTTCSLFLQLNINVSKGWGRKWRRFFLLQGGTINSSLIQCKLLVGKQTENFNLITQTHEGHFYSRIKLWRTWNLWIYFRVNHDLLTALITDLLNKHGQISLIAADRLDCQKITIHRPATKNLVTMYFCFRK